MSVDYLLGRKITFASRLQEIRKSLKLSYQEFASELGVSYETLVSWENGGSVPKIDELDVLAETLGVTTDYLLGISNNYGKDYQEYIERRKKQDIDFSKRLPIQALFKQLSQDKKETLYDVALKLWNFQLLENEKKEIEENKLQT
ncbi:helix-turn-helix domain-containing protein [Lactococcus garvieae]|uniref:helix-turn-helix domain-containing protein n=1 Tax=Lactococcus garvieae TaxID=1363 RepID=UPI0025513296|nr:helix-turn-helix transcriptional regulator [Lactococcus garvieae]